MISAKRFKDLELKASWATFENYKHCIEQAGGKILMPEEVKDVKRIFKA